MDITGKIIAILPEASGEGKNGPWRSRDAVLETQEQYPRKVCFNLFGDKIDQYKFEIGDEVKVYFDIDSREYNGRWYTNIRAWKVELANSDSANASATQPANESSAPQYEPEGDDDLPF